MPLLPHSILLASSNFAIAISSYRINVLDSASGVLVSSSEESSRILQACLDDSTSHLVTITEDKALRVWCINPKGELSIVSTRKLPKKPSCLAFDQDPSGLQPWILVGDKFGDVFRYPLHPSSDTTKLPKDQQSTATHPIAETKDGTLLLGHTSILTAILLTGSRQSSRRYIITSDRDEHIRISRYPQSFVVDGWCLGSKAFVNSIHLLKGEDKESEILLSGGGENVIRFWDWRQGKCMTCVEVGGAVRPFLCVKSSKRPRLEDGEEEDESTAENGIPDPKEDNTPEYPLAIQKISSVIVAGEQQIVFSAIGASCLFFFVAPQNIIDVSSSTRDPLHGVVHSSPDFGTSVLDFVCYGSYVLVSLDTSSLSGKEARSVEGLEWQASKTNATRREFQLVPVEDTKAPLLKGLNECVKDSSGATPNFYELLTVLPKALNQPIEELMEVEQGTPGGRSGVRKAARAGLRKALTEKLKANEGTVDEGPESKKTRLES